MIVLTTFRSAVYSTELNSVKGRAYMHCIDVQIPDTSMQSA